MTDSDPKARNTTLQGIALGLLAFAVYATHDAAIKTLGSRYTAFQIVFFVVLFSFPFVTLMLLRSDTKDNLRPRMPLWTALRTGGVVVGGFCAFYAFSVLPLTETYAILFTTPLMITVLSIPILGEVVRRHRWIAVIMGLVGVLVVLRPGASSLGLGHLSALIASFGAALAGVIMRRIGAIERREVLLLHPMLANFAIMLCILPFVYVPMPMRDIGLMLLIAVLAVVAMSFMIRAYALADAALVAPMQYSQIIWAALFGWLFFGETSDLGTLIGASIIIASGAYIVLRERQGGSENKPVLKTMHRRPEMAGAPRVSLVIPPDHEAVEQADERWQSER